MNSLIPLLFCCAVFNPGNTALGDLQGENSRMAGCGRDEVLLSNNRTLAPLDMIQASNSLEDIITADATDVYSSGTTTWCTDNRDNDPYIDLQFTSPVLISRMLTRGYTRLRVIITCSIRRYYVTNFTLEYSPPDNSSVLNYYTSTDESAASSESKMYFAAPEFTTLIQFERPFLTQRIRLRPVEWFDDDGTDLEFVCLGVALYGCLQSEVRNTSTVDTQPEKVNDTKSLSIVLSITLITIAGLIVLVGVLVYLLIRKQTAKKNVRNPDSGYLFMERSQQSLSDEHSFTVSGAEGIRHSNHETRQSSIIKKVDNPIYGKDRKASMDGQSHTYSSISEPDYEPVDSSKPQATEGQPRYLEYGNTTAKDGLDAIPEDNEENVSVIINSSYKPVEVGEQSDASNGVHLEGSAPRADSMVDNRAYNRESYDGCVSRPSDSRVEEEGQYEAIVALQSNSSYNYVTTMPLPSPSRED